MPGATTNLSKWCMHIIILTNLNLPVETVEHEIGTANMSVPWHLLPDHSYLSGPEEDLLQHSDVAEHSTLEGQKLTFSQSPYPHFVNL